MLFKHDESNIFSVQRRNPPKIKFRKKKKKKKKNKLNNERLASCNGDDDDDEVGITENQVSSKESNRSLARNNACNPFLPTF